MIARLIVGCTCLGYVPLALLAFPAVGADDSPQVTVNATGRGESPAALTETTELRQIRERLLQIEKRVLPPVLVPGPNSHASLPEYYIAENPELLARFQEGKRAFSKTPSEPYRAVTLVAGLAGVGKTFLKGEVYGSIAEKADICKFDIEELYDQWDDEGLAFHRPDIFCGNVDVSWCSSLRDKKKHLLRDYLAKQNASFYVIDSLDEIHPADCQWVLDEVERFVFQGDRRFVCVAVFGRSHAFRNYWRMRQKRGYETNTKLFFLHPPVFRTTGDLLVSNWNYHTWRFSLKWSPEGGEPEPLSLDDYRAWVASDFSRAGRFQSISCQENEDMRSDVQDRFIEWAGRYPVVCSMLYNLAGNSMIREILREDVLAGEPYDEPRVMREYFERWLIRETEANHTPSLENPKHLDLYLTALERLAVKYVDDVNDEGFFTVLDEDRVVVPFGGQELSFPAKAVLNRSGMKLLDPRKEGEAEYRFEPFWLHRMLVERHHNRLTSQ
jgi:hypothetical protein